MKSILKTLLVLVLVGAVALFGFGYHWWTKDPRPGPGSADPDSERITAGGPVVGFDAGNGTHGWLGIPYAAPPVDALRWRAPRPAEGWDGIRQALVAGPPCPQLGGPLTDVPRAAYGDVVGDEDCLTLNVWAPRHSASEVEALATPYPVMVWIHGGGNTVGYGADYDGRYLAASQEVVVVTFNYRLGVLGWFNHPAVVGDADNPGDASGNFGTLDQVAVLEWVQENIAAFGGDPGRVTVFGESAGGLNTYGLLASPLARDLMHGAISQSGLARSTSPDHARDFRTDGGHPASARELTSRWLMEQGRASDRAAADQLQSTLTEQETEAFLRGLSAVDLINGFSAPGGMYRAPALLRDGHVLPDRPMLDILGDPSATPPIPVMAGSNRDEAKLFMAVDGRYVMRHWGVMLEIRDPAVYNGVAALISDHWRLTGVDQPLDALAGAHPARQYSYRFDWDETGSGRIADMPELMGAAHGFELPFVFGDFGDLWGIPLLWTDDNEAGRLALSEAMMDYWGAFAHDGTPGRGRTETRNVWPGWGASGGTALRLDAVADGGIEPLEWRMDIAQLHQGFVALQDELPPGIECGLYAWLFYETPAWEPARFDSFADCGGRSPTDLVADPFGQ